MLTLESAKLGLAEARGRIVVAPRVMLADMALFGLLDDVHESIAVAELVLETKFYYRAAGLIRTAYEAGQQAMVLATEEDYSASGAAMLIYFKKKDLAIAKLAKAGLHDSAIAESEAEYEKGLAGLRSLWIDHWPPAEQIFDEARFRVEALPPKPDNWLGKDMPSQVEQSYGRLTARLGGSAPDGVRATTRGAFAALSLGAHLRPELPEAVLKNAAGELTFRPRPRNRERVRTSLIAGATAAVGEAMLAAAYRVAVVAT